MSEKEPIEPKVISEEKAPVSWTKRLRRLATRVLLVILILLVSLIALIHLPVVQNWAASKVTTFLSEELETEVSLDYIRISIWKGLVLDNFYVEDLQGDTLLYADNFSVNLRRGLFSLVRGNLAIGSVEIVGAQLNWVQRTGSESHNLQFVLDYLAEAQAKEAPLVDTLAVEKPRPVLDFDLRELVLRDIDFIKADSVWGQRQDIHLGLGEFFFDHFDLAGQSIHVKDVRLKEPTIRIQLLATEKWLESAENWVPNPFEPLVPDAYQAKEDTSAWLVQVDDFRLRKGVFRLNNFRRTPVKLTPRDILDYNHMDVFDISIDLTDLKMEKEVLTGSLDRLVFEDISGFNCEEFSAKELRVSGRQAELNGMVLRSETSELGDTLIFKYKHFSDFRDFNNRVRMDIRVKDGLVSVDDIMTFAPILENNPFFQKNRKKFLKLEGQILGVVDQLKGRDLRLLIGNDSYVEGSFGFFGLMDPENRAMTLNLDRLNTDMKTLRELIPGINLPANYNKLGRLDFRGDFAGFFTDFVANGTLRTGLGRADMDMRMNLRQGRQTARYSGNLNLANFDLQRWTENPDLGTISFRSKVLDGVGLTAETANARLEAKIDSFYFRNYQYQNLEIEGQLNQNLFNGKFAISDENIAFNFDGTIDFTSNEPLFDFQAAVEKVDVKALNLWDRDLIVGGNVDLSIRNKKPNRVDGSVLLSDLTFLHNQDSLYQIDSILAISINRDTFAFLSIFSDLLNFDLKGDYELAAIPNAVTHLLTTDYPTFSEKLGLKPPETVDSVQFSMRLEVFNTKGLMSILDPNLGKLNDTRLEVAFDSYQDSMALDLSLPRLAYGNVTLEDIVVIMEGARGFSDIDIGVYQTRIGENMELAPLNLLGLVNRDTFDFRMTGYDFTNFLNKLEVDGQLFATEEDLVVRFMESDVIFLNELWSIRENNLIRFGKDFIQTRDFALTNGNRKIVLESQGKEGLKLGVEGFNLNDLNSWIDYEPLIFDGWYTVTATVGNVFELSDLSLGIKADTIQINSDRWGLLEIEAGAKNIRSKVDTRISLVNGTQKIEALGYYNLPTYQPPGNNRSQVNERPNYFDFDLTAAQIPMWMLEYWLGSAISSTVGRINGALKVEGTPQLPNVRGVAYVPNGATTIDYLNTRYFIEGGQLKISNDLIKVEKGILRDELGNPATVSGGIRHERLRNFNLDARIVADTFLVLNTNKGQNNLYYGRAIGAGDIRFTGPFSQINIDVTATSQAGTRIVIPTEYEQNASAVNFIKFRKPNPISPQVQVNANPTEPRGINIAMDLNLTSEALVEIVFDEQTGDILRGRGDGTLQIQIPRGGEFQMYGDYVVESGSYLFTLMSLAVNKPFSVRQGGTIRWKGDPFGAEINLKAEYQNIQANLTNLISEYLITATDRAKNEARQSADVNLIMALSGELLNPTINFDIEFPNLTGELKNYTDSKLRVIRQDENEMNRQVFGLIVVGQFVPSGLSAQNTQFNLNIGINTVTEMLSQQLSLYLTELVSEWLREDGLITGIDFDIAYKYIQGQDILGENPNEVYSSNELQFQLKNYLFNDRLSVNLGGEFDIGESSNYVGPDPNAGVFFAGDLVIEYVLTKDRNLTIRFYQSTEPEIGGGRRNKTGLGLSFRKEFDTFSEFLNGLKKTTKEIDNQ